MSALLTSSEVQAHTEAQASLGHDAYLSMPRLRDAWVLWNLARKREAEEVRARRREARERRWQAIAEGSMEPLTTSAADHQASLREPGSETTFEAAMAEMRAQRRELAKC